MPRAKRKGLSELLKPKEKKEEAVEATEEETPEEDSSGVVFVHKSDPFGFIEVETTEPVADDNPETFAPGGQPGRWLDIRYRKMGSDDEWTYTTRGVLTREYRALNGKQAKELISPSGSEA